MEGRGGLEVAVSEGSNKHSRLCHSVCVVSYETFVSTLGQCGHGGVEVRSN